MSVISLSSGGLWVWVWGLWLVLAAGCGGGSNGGGGGGGGSTTVTFTVSGATPTSVAAKVGSGAYTAQTLGSGTLTLSVPSGTTNFAVAYVCPPQTLPLGTSTRQTVLQASTADGTSFRLACAQTPKSPQTGTLAGSVDASAIPGISYVGIEAANGSLVSGTVLSGLNSSFSFSAPAGSDRIETLAYLNSPVGSVPATASLVAVKNLDNQQVPGQLNGGNPVVLTAADQTTPQMVTYNNVPSGFANPTLQVLFNMAGKAEFTVASGPGISFPALPAPAVESGDSYFFIASDYQSSIVGIGRGQGVAVSATLPAATTAPTAGPMTFTFPVPWSYTGPAPAALPTFDFSYSGFTGEAGIQRLATLTWLAGTASAMDENSFMVQTTGGFLDGSPQVTFPDLSSLTGFLNAPVSGTKVNWSAEIGQTAPSSSTDSIVVNVGAYTVP